MFLRYLKDNRKILYFPPLCALIFALVFSLYRLPVSAAFYGALLCLLVGFFFAVFDFYAYAKKHRELCRLQKGIPSSLSELPLPQNLTEDDYHHLLEEAKEALCLLSSKAAADKTEMTDFYTLWVHQIKTPIAAMSVLLQQNDTPANAALLSELFKIERYTELVLGYLRLDEMSSDLQLSSFSLEKIVSEAVKKYAPLFIHQKISLQTKGLDLFVLTDEKWLCFVLEQLLSNALKYTRTGTIKIYTEEPKTLVIEDTGIGISPEDIARVFEKGFTGFNGRMDKKSTGLGLYLCKKTLEKLHHGISITSVPGVGTWVRLSLSSADFRHE